MFQIYHISPRPRKSSVIDESFENEYDNDSFLDENNSETPIISSDNNKKNKIIPKKESDKIADHNTSKSRNNFKNHENVPETGSNSEEDNKAMRKKLLIEQKRKWALAAKSKREKDSLAKQEKIKRLALIAEKQRELVI